MKMPETRGKIVDQANDPYRAPAGAISEAPIFLGMETAGRWRRFLGYLVDSVVLWVLNVVGIIVLMAMAGSFEESAVSTVQQLVLSLSLTVCYYLVMEGIFARTLGKFACGTRVVGSDGGQPSFGQVLGRTFSRFIPFECFAIFGEQRLMLHDSLAQTRVVRVGLPA